jgi:tRNA-specific 2-thiouridylase
MSGGVDSSVAAARLVQQGYTVIGMMLRLWSEPGYEAENRCCTPEAMALARRVAAKLGIPFYAVDAQAVFRQQVVQYLLDGYLRGDTPNPCLACNRHVRWEFLLQHALALGAEHLATGHYARLHSQDGQVQLWRGVDRNKDQSYVLSMLTQAKLQRSLFPLGEYTKPQVRQMAREFDLPVAERADSQDLCFLGPADYRDFLRRQAPQAEKPGPILNRAGEEVGQHQGLAFYTIGQRKGLGIAAPQPLYVLDKEFERNALIVGGADELGRSALLAAEVNWVSGQPPAEPQRMAVKIRYRATEAWGMVTPLDAARAEVRFEAPVRDITPGQVVVFYDGDLCLGGGIIQAALK